MPVQWGDNRSRLPKQYRGLRVRSVAPLERVEAILLGELTTALVHYTVGVGDAPCLGPDCRLCPAGRRRKGYLHAQLRRVERFAAGSWSADRAARLGQAVLELTEGGCIELEDLDPLRGLQVELWRAGQARNAPLRVRVAGRLPAEEAARLPSELDPKPLLLRLWNLLGEEGEREAPAEGEPGEREAPAPAVIPLAKAVGDGTQDPPQRPVTGPEVKALLQRIGSSGE